MYVCIYGQTYFSFLFHLKCFFFIFLFFLYANISAEDDSPLCIITAQIVSFAEEVQTTMKSLKKKQI